MSLISLIFTDSSLSTETVKIGPFGIFHCTVIWSKHELAPNTQEAESSVNVIRFSV
jgi:hypothetical protein